MYVDRQSSIEIHFILSYLILSPIDMYVFLLSSLREQNTFCFIYSKVNTKFVIFEPITERIKINILSVPLQQMHFLLL